jgi:ubiquinone/menaquinone biosynthesis C-methylase UbiE
LPVAPPSPPPAAARRSRSDADTHLAEVAEGFDRFADVEARWRRRNRTYHRLIESLTGLTVQPGMRVLEIGSGRGDLLASLQPSRGVGIDISERMVEAARGRFPELEFHIAAGEHFVAEETFDYVVLSDLVPFAYDLHAILTNVARMTHPRSRVIVHSYSQLWRPVIRLAERLGLKYRKPIRNWVTVDDIRNLLDLAGFEVVSTSRRILFPKRVPLLSSFLNGFVANVWPFTQLTLTYWVVARPKSERSADELTVSVVVPCRNEAATVAEIVERVPELGAGTELVFVEGGSTDDTRAEIERQIALHPERRISLFVQEGRGKADAVRLGFAQATGEVLIILDGDLTVSPDDLPKFYDAIVAGRAELANGSRLVYELEPQAMQFLNIVGNKAFSLLFTFLIGQYVKDTLCGTKALRRSDYERIVQGRAYFGDFDPFGDFDLLLGGARLGLRITDLPVRYSARRYGTTNISRFQHGWLLLRMAVFAFWKLKVEPVRVGGSPR